MIIILILAIIAEIIDSGLGMMFGTILSPVLIIMGYSPTDVVPSILLAQALGGIIASYRHHTLNNATFTFKSKDFKVGTLIYSLGIIAAFIGAYLALKVDKSILKNYIGVLVICMGLLVVSNIKFKFSWKSITGLGILSSFNKALSGGGFGPVLSSGQIILGRESKNSIATTDFAEVPLCLASFIFWLILKNDSLNILLITSLSIGSMIGAYIGPYLLSKLKSDVVIKKIVGGLALLLGILVLFTKISI